MVARPAAEQQAVPEASGVREPALPNSVCHRQGWISGHPMRLGEAPAMYSGLISLGSAPVNKSDEPPGSGKWSPVLAATAIKQMGAMSPPLIIGLNQHYAVPELTSRLKESKIASFSSTFS